MTNTERLDNWIRSDFVALNTALEEIYFSSEMPEEVEGKGDELKRQLEKEGKSFIVDLLKEGNTNEGFDAGFSLLGNVGLYMAACRRHMITEPSRETKSPLVEASALAMQLGASLGVVPRFASAHLENHNYAINGVAKSFTSLPDEILFLTHNTRAELAFIRASEALLRILPLGVSHPITADLLLVARRALEDVLTSNNELFTQLDTDRFFYCVRPYYKPHRVGLHEYRGANAGDFAGINVIDLLLGVCRADDSYYSQLLVDKFLFMTPDDQLILRDCMSRESLLDQFLRESITNHTESWYQKNVALFLDVAKAHGATALQHHEQLVSKFIEKPADNMGLSEKPGLTASGPPLPVLLRSLRKLADLRSAADRDDIPSRFSDMQKLRASLA
ncbi:PrnB family protein [Luminiphilus syltensis]|nr:monodechloroaminopyrrolnitrin synthase PrnB family protein [Luminiphilus syltensis]